VEHFIASPATDGQAVFVSGLGLCNSATFQALHPQSAAASRQRWLKGPPYLKLPLASSPAIAGGLWSLATACTKRTAECCMPLRADTGLPVWQYPVPGTLIHLEGGPAIVDGKVFIGGGNAGVICVDSNRLELDGKPVDRAAVEADLEKRWQELLAKYEQERRSIPISRCRRATTLCRSRGRKRFGRRAFGSGTSMLRWRSLAIVFSWHPRFGSRACWRTRRSR
jgi:hypothetical protein